VSPEHTEQGGRQPRWGAQWQTHGKLKLRVFAKVPPGYAT
jgi:hypothetical protein